MDEKEKKSYLYLRFSIFIFVFFFVLLILVAIILCFILLSPLAPLLLRGFASTTIITIVSVYLASAVLSSFFSYFVGKRILKKFVELSAKSKRVAEGDFSVRIEGKSVIPELENVLNSFNQMVEELGKVDTLSNDFVANVSHEFKAPLAVIRSNVNILENSLLNIQIYSNGQITLQELYGMPYKLRERYIKLKTDYDKKINEAKAKSIT